MSRRILWLPTALATLTMAALPAAQAGTLLDDFNRPNAATLGPNWTNQSGGEQIVNGHAEDIGTSFSLATYNGISSNSISVDVAVDSVATNYIALVLGYADLTHNYFIKLQQQNAGGTTFDTVAFYYGNNGSNNAAAMTKFFNLAPADKFGAGHITATETGTQVELDIQPVSGPLQVYSWDYGTATGGSGIGLGFLQGAEADNFSADVPEPEGVLSFASGLLGLGALRRSRRSP